MYNQGADPAAGKGGGKLLTGAVPLAGVQGAEPPGGGCKGNFAFLSSIRVIGAYSLPTLY